MKHCAKCTWTKYCSKACQKADWKEHKLVCIVNATVNAWDKKKGTTTIIPPAKNFDDETLATGIDYIGKRMNYDLPDDWVAGMPLPSAGGTMVYQA